MCGNATLGFQGRTPQARERHGGRARAAHVAIALCFPLALGACAERSKPPAGDVATQDPRATPAPAAAAWEVDTIAAGRRFRPAGFSDTLTAWGIERGRLARLSLGSDSIGRTAHEAWDASAAPGVVAWRNERGAWLWRRGAEPERIAGPEPRGEFEGPPDVLLDPEGGAALLSWRAEWSLHHELRTRTGAQHPLEVGVPGYMALAASLFLDSTAILFGGAATGPRGGEPEYRESGWRRDLFRYALQTGRLERVTDVPDGTFLHIAGRYRGYVLVAEHGPAGARGFWLYDPATWRRGPIPLPPGRAHGHGRVISVLAEPRAGDPPELLLVADDTLRLGTAADPDAPPAASADGRTLLARVTTPAGARLLRIRAP